ncbi:MAG TPA: DUF2264 domain-containing protein [Paludibacter sp.]|nr:DUF2264 domain-containing protein [Paludibacter sp.]
MNKLVAEFTLILFLFVSNVALVRTQNAPTPTKPDGRVFELDKPDYKLSPHTGMTRQHWKDAALYMLEGAFGYIRQLDDPMKFPKQPGISYPRSPDQIPTEKLEGLSRTLFVAAPLLKENPELVVNDIKVADYYRHQLCNLINPSSPSFIKHRAKNGGPHQNLVEFGAMAISMSVIPDVLWKPLPQNQKDSLAALMLSYADGPTVDSNWKFFNIFVLSFFKDQGYAVNEKLLLEYLDKTLLHYRGEGWYNDSPAYDYYSMWAFQMYGVLWAEYYGNKYYPERAKKFMSYFADLKSNYPYLFSRGGKMIMWGRSISYRYASVTPFPLMGFENSPGTNYGWMRRIASGTLLQFFQHPGFMKDGVPTLGFYGPFEPAVQMYSCRGSVYWGGKVFLGLLVPADNPFWTAVENEGDWETKLVKGEVYNKFEPGSKILVTDYPNIGASEVRAWCHESVAADWQKFRSTENYNRLSYNSAFPWQADGQNGEVAMNYVVKNRNGNWEALRLFTFRKFENGTYYRDAELETNKDIQFKLADIPLPNGILRVDKLLSPDSVELRLGHYSLPQFKEPMKEEIRKVEGHQVRIINNGVYQLAMVSLSGWEAMEFVHATGLHPESDQSEVIDVSDRFTAGATNQKAYVTLMLWKKAGEKWTNGELLPVKKIHCSAIKNDVTILFRSGEKKVVDFD